MGAYVCIDLKSFYASVECAERGLDPFSCNLVVADPERTERTICLAATPAMRALGVKSRCRLFEIPEGIDCIVAPPRMRLYMQRSAEIYGVYLRYVAPEDVHVYSIDECFVDAAPYLSLYGTDARGIARMLMGAVFRETGICATAGVGENLFLAKVALDVLAKGAPDGVAELDAESFKERIWFHEPITDIWRVGPGTARRLAKYGVTNLAGVAAMDPGALHREFGRQAEYLIDHAWGLEPCTMADIKAYSPKGRSVCSGQVLPRDYSKAEARIAMREMADACALELSEKGMAAGRAGLSIGFSAASGLPPTGGSRALPRPTCSRAALLRALERMFDASAPEGAPVRRIQVSLSDLVPEGSAQPSLFDGIGDGGAARERDLQRAVSAVHGRFGANSLLRLSSLQEGATARERNAQVGGHRA